LFKINMLQGLLRELPQASNQLATLAGRNPISASPSALTSSQIPRRAEPSKFAARPRPHPCPPSPIRTSHARVPDGIGRGQVPRLCPARSRANKRSTPQISQRRSGQRTRASEAGKDKCVPATEICRYIKGLTYSGRNSSLDPQAERGKIHSVPNIPIGYIRPAIAPFRAP
jgi:hypothetical protein